MCCRWIIEPPTDPEAVFGEDGGAVVVRVAEDLERYGRGRRKRREATVGEEQREEGRGVSELAFDFEEFFGHGFVYRDLWDVW